MTRLPKQTVGVVLPTDYAFNPDRTSIFISMGVTFISHAHNAFPSRAEKIGILLYLCRWLSMGAAAVAARRRQRRRA
ncbi:hypothetical protein [Paraburkholderia sp. PGU19]|uniref:hypothetical protein n=1 Tax=Paraburkholderia sp. PGU19 TaxID=2735434 RepID=UPI0015D9EDFD|nr:hypothetical protein [Paraburkholderia sp. PGU19]